VLDIVIALRRSADYTPDSDSVFEVRFEKARGIDGGDVVPFEASRATDAEGKQSWTTRTVEHSVRERVAALLDHGMSQQDIAAQFDGHRAAKLPAPDRSWRGPGERRNLYGETPYNSKPPLSEHRHDRIRPSRPALGA
jgi:putative DNA primase/helicase